MPTYYLIDIDNAANERTNKLFGPTVEQGGSSGCFLKNEFRRKLPNCPNYSYWYRESYSLLSLFLFCGHFPLCFELHSPFLRLIIGEMFQSAVQFSSFGESSGLHSANQTQVITIIIIIILAVIIIVGAAECLFGSIVQRRATSHETSISHCATLIIVGHSGTLMGYASFTGQLRSSIKKISGEKQ